MDITDIIRAGRYFHDAGLVTAASGNLSIRCGDRLLITCTGSVLGNLCESDIVTTGIDADDDNTKRASSELAVHREIYRRTAVKTIAHAHPLHSTALSMKERKIVPVSPEVLAVTGIVPVLGWGMEIRPGGLADIIAGALKSNPIVMVRGHGTFAAADTLDEACRCTVLFEDDCRTHRPAKPEEMVHFG